MNQTLSALLLASFAAAAPLPAAVIQISTAAQFGPGNDRIEFSNWGVDTSLGLAFSKPSDNGKTIGDFYLTSGDYGFIRKDQDNPWMGDFPSGAALVYTDYRGTSMEVIFSNPVKGLGLTLQAGDIGPFAAQIQLFDPGAGTLATFSNTGDSGYFGAGTPLFLGAISDSYNIKRAVITLTSSSNLEAGFAFGEITLVPEPGPLALGAVTLLGAGLWQWRRRGLAR